MPKRVQRKRSSGWKKPENTVYVGRGSKWGNPFRVGYSKSIKGEFGSGGWANLTLETKSAKQAVQQFEMFVTTGITYFITTFKSAEINPESIREGLKGKDLMCWCAIDQPCHADVLLAIANGGNQ